MTSSSLIQYTPRKLRTLLCSAASREGARCRCPAASPCQLARSSLQQGKAAKAWLPKQTYQTRWTVRGTLQK